MSKNSNNKEKKTPITRFLSWVETLEQKFLSNRFLNFILKTKHPSYTAIEIFVILDIVFAFVMILLLGCPPSIGHLIWIPIIGWAAYRIIEIVMFALFALLTSREWNILNKERMLVLFILNYFEIIFWFAFFYRILYNLVDKSFLIAGDITLNSVSGSLYFSVVTMTTLGYGDITPNHVIAMFLISIQTLIGLYIALIILGWFIQFFKPDKNLEEEK